MVFLYIAKSGTPPSFNKARLRKQVTANLPLTANKLTSKQPLYLPAHRLNKKTADDCCWSFSLCVLCVNTIDLMTVAYQQISFAALTASLVLARLLFSLGSLPIKLIPFVTHNIPKSIVFILFS